jgi:MFS family permease
MDARAGSIVESNIPARLDRLRWGRFHTVVIVALGITWILDGLEVTLAGSISGALKDSAVLRLTDEQIGLSASFYLVGAVTGALGFGWLADRLGRKRLFNITLGVYLVATALTAFSTDFFTFALFRALTGAGIGGEYAAINSAIQELIPARYRGRIDLLVNGSFWVGAALGACGAVVLLQPGFLPADIGWRLAFALGAILGLGILYLRRFLPESPRWLMTHGRVEEGESVLAEIERRFDLSLPSGDTPRVRLRMRGRSIGQLEMARTLFRTYPKRRSASPGADGFGKRLLQRDLLHLCAWFSVIWRSRHRIGLHILPFAVAIFGPLLLGPLSEWWRKPSRGNLRGIRPPARGHVHPVRNHALDAVRQTVVTIVFFLRPRRRAPRISRSGRASRWRFAHALLLCSTRWARQSAESSGPGCSEA